MKHLVLIIEDGWVSYRMNDQHGSHPIGDDTAQWVIEYLLKTIKPDSHEVLVGLNIL